MKLPRTCQFCAAELMHYGSCNCVDGQLEAVDAERKQLNKRLSGLAEKEKSLLRERSLIWESFARPGRTK